MPSDGWYKSGHLRIENTTHCYLVCQRLTPLVTSRWGLVCRRAICSKQARCRAVSCTRGETVGAGAMAVGIRNSFRKNWALFSFYDTMPPSVRILLPSTTSALLLAATTQSQGCPRGNRVSFPGRSAQGAHVEIYSDGRLAKGRTRTVGARDRPRTHACASRRLLGKALQ